MTAAATVSNNTTPSTMTTIDLVRERLILLLWAGSLCLVLKALYDLPTTTTTITTAENPHLRGTPQQQQHYSSLANWQPLLEEESRATNMLQSPVAYLLATDEHTPSK